MSKSVVSVLNSIPAERLELKPFSDVQLTRRRKQVRKVDLYAEALEAADGDVEFALELVDRVRGGVNVFKFTMYDLVIAVNRPISVDALVYAFGGAKYFRNLSLLELVEFVLCVRRWCDKSNARKKRTINELAGLRARDSILKAMAQRLFNKKALAKGFKLKDEDVSAEVDSFGSVELERFCEKYFAPVRTRIINRKNSAASLKKWWEDVKSGKKIRPKPTIADPADFKAIRDELKGKGAK
jgi:hypothetical protein